MEPVRRRLLKFHMLALENGVMKKGPIGVWFSLALALFALSVWLGSMLGSRVARLWYRHHQLEYGRLSRAERTRVESELGALSAIQILRVYDLLAQEDKKLRDKYLDNEIRGLEEIKLSSNVEGVRPLIDFHLGLAHVTAAMEKDQENQEELAKKHLDRAQALFNSLGWRDTSVETLEGIAKHEQWGSAKARSK
jgi:hypothetical protein